MLYELNVILPLRLSFLDYPENSHSGSLYIMGCDNFCLGCHNPEFSDHDYSIGTSKLDLHTLVCKIVSGLRELNTKNLVLLGGDPLCFHNIQEVKSLILLLKDYDIDICIYTGKDISFVKDNDVIGFKYLKCGEYDKNLSQMSNKTDDFFALSSKNQKLYDKYRNLISTEGYYYYNRM